ncbi:MAG TPA: hypothetical protein PLV25_07140, partial [Opitutales bacterium]|nr:hypothetical protein [Opitutales bacterium]
MNIALMQHEAQHFPDWEAYANYYEIKAARFKELGINLIVAPEAVGLEVASWEVASKAEVLLQL